MKKISGIIFVLILVLTNNVLYSKEKKKNKKKPVKITWDSQGQKYYFKIKYNKENNIVQLDQYFDSKLQNYLVNEFDGQGNVIKETKYDSDKNTIGYKTSTYDKGKVMESKFFDPNDKLTRIVKFVYKNNKWVKTLYLDNKNKEVASITNKFNKKLISQMKYEVKIGERVYSRVVNLTYENDQMVTFQSDKSSDGAFLDVRIFYEKGKITDKSYHWMIVSICVN